MKAPPGIKFRKRRARFKKRRSIKSLRAFFVVRTISLIDSVKERSVSGDLPENISSVFDERKSRKGEAIIVPRIV